MSSNRCITWIAEVDGRLWLCVAAQVKYVYAGLACCWLDWMAALSVTTAPLKAVCASVALYKWILRSCVVIWKVSADVVWLGSTVVRALELWFEIAGSIPAAVLSSAALGRLFTHTRISVTKQYNLGPVKRRWWVTDFVLYIICRLKGLNTGRWASTPTVLWTVAPLHYGCRLFFLHAIFGSVHVAVTYCLNLLTFFQKTFHCCQWPFTQLQKKADILVW